MITQRSPEWFVARVGKLTGSNIGAALGINPWKTPEELIRQMVRDTHGAPSEFVGNIATDYGQLHEPLAVMDYSMATGNDVDECGFYVHPEHEWLGASPDGFIGPDGLLEVKCPFGLRNSTEPEFKTAEQQPHYYAQMQIEMACTGRRWCHFYQWAPNGNVLELICFDADWFNDALPKLKAFYDLYLSEIDNPVHLEPLKIEVNTLTADALIKEWDELRAAIDDAEARKKEVLAALVGVAGERDAVICGRKLTKVERAGSVAYAKVVAEHCKGLDLEPYRGKPTEFWKLS